MILSRFSLCVLMCGGGVTATLSSASAQQACEGDWVTVNSRCQLPDDLRIGDRVQITVGSAVNTRGAVTGWEDCDGHRTYYISRNQTGCGWRDAITAYSRSQETGRQAATPETGTESEALQIPDSSGQ